MYGQAGERFASSLQHLPKRLVLRPATEDGLVVKLPPEQDAISQEPPPVSRRHQK
ncbi:unnamed protein product [Clonostachys byssicola]|uniref:Uncharacterized protein n=1 Tax=Clonostachys byssicola TaxID=160290 RepID=A0A9N9Y0M6_9HYPO|nr:unnamed protein product [Clonostachys byssicola]